MVEKNPKLLLAILQKMPAARSTSDLFRVAGGMLMRSDEESADKVLAGVPDGPLKNAMVVNQYRGMIAQDPAGTLVKVLKIEDAGMRTEAVRVVGDFMGQQGLEETRKVAETLTGEDRETFLMRALSWRASENSRELAAALVKEDFALPQERRNSLIRSTGANLAYDSASDAKEWFARLPQESRGSAMSGIAMNMAREDAVGLADWLSEMPRDENWQVGVEALVGTLKEADPERAAVWEAELEKETAAE
jgi:hypothetical protein